MLTKLADVCVVHVVAVKKTSKLMLLCLPPQVATDRTCTLVLSSKWFFTTLFEKGVVMLLTEEYPAPPIAHETLIKMGDSPYQQQHPC